MRRWVMVLVFGVSATAGAVALGWLTAESLRLDRQRDEALAETRAAKESESQARVAIDRRDRISRAVWRMDSMLTPLVAQEATRAPLAYRAFGQGPVNPSYGRSGGERAIKQQQPQQIPGTTLSPSPLLVNPSAYVLLHFQVDCDGCWSSPQVPLAEEVDWARQFGVDDAVLTTYRDRLARLEQGTDLPTLLQQLPDELMAVDPDTLLAGNPFDVDVLPTQTPAQTSEYAQQSLQRFNTVRGGRMAASQAEPTVEEAVDQAESTTPPLFQVEGKTPEELRDWNQRNRILESFTNGAIANQSLLYGNGVEPTEPLDGWRLSTTRAFWFEGHLLLARRTRLEGGSIGIQGCWLDWEQLSRRLRDEVRDILPNVQLAAVTEQTPFSPTMLLATLPVELVVPDEGPTAGTTTMPPGEPAAPRGVVRALAAAWAGLGLAIAALGVLLIQSESLSERRARFVASVTHELRTPLTTFRMYTEMLGLGMVTGEVQRAEYVRTLKGEAERLTHLVDNVLSYSRLEHGRRRTRRSEIHVPAWWERLETRLAERVANADAVLEGPDRPLPDVTVLGDPTSLEQIVFNLIDNACKYGLTPTSRSIRLVMEVRDGRWSLAVTDQGQGIDSTMRRRIFRAFSKSDTDAAGTAPGIGLGLSISRRMARQGGGRLVWDESWTPGARFVLTLPIHAVAGGV